MTKSKYIKLLWALFGLILICLFLPYEYGIDYNICDIENMDENCVEVYFWGFETRQFYFILFFNSIILLTAFSFNLALIAAINSFYGFFLLIVYLSALAPSWGAVPISPTVSYGYYLSMIGTISLFMFTMFNLKKNANFLINKTRSNLIVYTVGSISFVLFFLFISFIGKG
jgi:hypothetical protein